MPGRLVLPSTEEGAPPVLALTFDPQAALADDPTAPRVRDVTLSLRRAADRPSAPSRSPPGSRRRSALAADMDATIVDDNGQPLTLHGFAAIGSELKQLYGTLEARDLAAGSAAARRLFS